MKTKILLFLIISLSLFLLWTGCEKDPIEKPDPEPVDTINMGYVVYPDKIESLLNEIVTFYWVADSADALVISGSFGEITDQNPIGGSLTFQMIEEGVSVIEFEFKFEQSGGKPDVFGSEKVSVEAFLPQKVDFPTEPVSWRTGAMFRLETHFADSTVISYAGVKTVLVGDYNGDFMTDPLDSNTVVNIITYNKLGKVEASETIYVAEPTMSDTLSSKMGSFSGIVAIEFELPGGGWGSGTPRFCWSDDTITFHPDSNMVWDSGEILCSDGLEVIETKWRSEGRTIILGNNDTRFIVALTVDTLVWEYNGLGGQLMTRETFIRIPNP